MKILLKMLIISFAFVWANQIYSQKKNTNLNCTNSDCHSDLLAKSIIHPPVNDDCLTCHEKVKGEHPNNAGKEFVLVEDGADLCGMCHDQEVTMKVVHVPFSDGRCLSCHSPHSSNIKGLLDGDNEKEVCGKCHKLDIEGHKYFHGPFVSNQCASCHLSHQSEIKNLLIKNDPQLCFQCHQEKEEILESEVVHPIYEEGCLNCHLPHSAEANYMLVSGKNDLCLNCHESVKNDIAVAKVVHGPILQEGQCISCHTPHAGELKMLLLDDEPDLCFRCHSENTKNKEKYIDILGRMGKKYLHQPLVGGKCKDCHLHHVSKFTNLLSAKFPKGNYTVPKKESFALCFNCHDSKMLDSKKITNETNFRNGTENLHFIHVMKKKSISCQSCHDMHGADNQHIIGNAVYFGSWQMPINYKVTEMGGSCLPGCHAQFTYSREE